MSELDKPTEPINGRVPQDLEYRIVDETTVEQWSEWSGTWDVAYHAFARVDAERYVREHDAKEPRDYRVAGLDRMKGAIGIFEPFLVTVTATSVEDAERVTRDTRWAAGREHVQIRVAAPVTDVDKRTDDLANAYWRARQEPGGTIENDKGGVSHSPKAAALWDEMGTIHGPAATENEATLVRCGMDGKLAKLLSSPKDLIVEESCLRLTGHSPVDGFRLDQLLSPPLRDVEAWCNSFRWVWTDDDRLMVTYCEGDLSLQIHFTPEAFQAAYADAERFYAEGY